MQFKNTIAPTIKTEKFKTVRGVELTKEFLSDGSYWLEQNPHAYSIYAGFVKDGHKVKWLINKHGYYIGPVCIDGRIYGSSTIAKRTLNIY